MALTNIMICVNLELYIYAIWTLNSHLWKLLIVILETMIFCKAPLKQYVLRKVLNKFELNWKTKNATVNPVD